jgi:hypothetical protein
MWLTCSGSLIPNVLAPDTAGAEAAEGTVAHGVGELWLKTGRKPVHLIGTVEQVLEDDQVFDITIDEVMLEYVQEYVDWCACEPGDHFVEVRVDFSDLTPIPDQGGTSDHMALSWQRAVCTDLKYGVGVKVYAEGNTQAMIYAYGVFREWDWFYDFQEIVIRICQPRLSHFDVWVITRAQLLEFAEYVRERAAAAWRHDAPRRASEKGCMWCKIKAGCGANAVLIARMTEGVFDNLDAEVTVDEVAELKEELEFGVPVKFNSAAQLSIDELAAIYRYKGVITKWLDEVGALLYKRLVDGEEVPDWKLVAGKSSRSFPNKEAAFEYLEFLGLDGEEIAPRVMVSPAGAEELLLKLGYKRKMLPELLKPPIVHRAPGGPTMVPSTDSRQPLNQQSEGVFDNLDDL